MGRQVRYQRGVLLSSRPERSTLSFVVTVKLTINPQKEKAK